MVTEICSDIKLLDYGKRHLTTAITSLKQLQSMGVHFVVSPLQLFRLPSPFLLFNFDPIAIT